MTIFLLTMKKDPRKFLLKLFRYVIMLLVLFLVFSNSVYSQKTEPKYHLGSQLIPEESPLPIYDPLTGNLNTNCSNSDFSNGNWINWQGCYGRYNNPCQFPGFKLDPPRPVHRLIQGPGYKDHNTCDTLMNVFPGEQFVARLGDTSYTTQAQNITKAGQLRYPIAVSSDSYLLIYRDTYHQQQINRISR
jgi:hypothetical protein